MDPTFLELSFVILETLTLVIPLRSSEVVTSLADTGLGFLKHQDLSDELLACQRGIDWAKRLRPSQKLIRKTLLVQSPARTAAREPWREKQIILFRPRLSINLRNK